MTPARAAHSSIFVPPKKRHITQMSEGKNQCARLESIRPSTNCAVTGIKLAQCWQSQTEKCWKVLIMLFYHLSRLWRYVDGWSEKNVHIIIFLSSKMWLHLQKLYLLLYGREGWSFHWRAPSSLAVIMLQWSDVGATITLQLSGKRPNFNWQPPVNPPCILSVDGRTLNNDKPQIISVIHSIIQLANDGSWWQLFPRAEIIRLTALHCVCSMIIGPQTASASP